MNKHVLEPATDPAATADALYSLSQTERKLAHRYRQWAAEAKTVPERQRWQTEATKYWEEAFWHLQRARMYRVSTYG